MTHAAGEPVVLISRTLARRFWTIAGAVGQTIVIDDGDAPRQARIVGVVGDVKHYGLDAEVTPDVYSPIPQVPDATVQWLNNNMYWGVRTTGDPGGAARRVPPRAARGRPRRAGGGDADDGRGAGDCAGAAAHEPVAGARVRRRSRCCWRAPASTR